MTHGRVTFGCTVNVQTREIFVAGGSSDGELISKCEVYDHQLNKWNEFPDLNEKKNSASLCVLASKWLYCFGGFEIDACERYQFLTSIEMISL
jgi:hypothetical protein